MKLFKQLMLGLIAASSIGTAVATPLTVTDIYSTAPVAIVSTGGTYNFWFDVSDDFTAGTDVLTAATMTLRLSDPLRGLETFSFVIGNTVDAQVYTQSGNNNVNNGNNVSNKVVVLNSNALSDLNADGKLQVFLKVNAGGNYTFLGGTLNASGTTPDIVITAPTNKVPEPLTLALMGIALAGVGASRRRK